MTLKEAIKILRDPARGGYKEVSKIPHRRKDEKRWKVKTEWAGNIYSDSPKYTEYTDKEIIHLAQIWTHNNSQNTVVKKNVKHFGKRKNRRATRDILNKGEFDKIPQNGRVEDEDIWSWD